MPRANTTDLSSSSNASTTAKAQLQVAIVFVSEARLRAVVVKLAQSLPAAENALIAELVTTKQKRKNAECEVAPRWKVCSNCRGEFDTNKRRVRGECSYHSGDLEVNYEMFEDWDEDCHGPMDSKANQREYPENFTWSCCDENGLAEGCEKGEHFPTTHKKARRT